MKIIKGINETPRHFSNLFLIVVNSIFESPLLFLINVPSLKAMIRMKMKLLHGKGDRRRGLVNNWIDRGLRVEKRVLGLIYRGLLLLLRNSYLIRIERGVPLDTLSVVSHRHDQVKLITGGIIDHLVKLDNIRVINLLHDLNLSVDLVKGGREIL